MTGRTDTDAIDILLVDDRPENLIALEAVLEAPGINILTAGSGRAALECCREHAFAVVLLDVQMPIMDGFETAEKLREDERTRLLPIIFVTAISKTRDYVFRGYDAGAVDYIFKPLDPDIVIKKVEIFIELFRQKREVERKTRELNRTHEELKKAYNRIKEDLDAASRVQYNLLPSELPSSEKFLFAWKYEPCEELAGDILNVLDLDDEHLGMYLLDVSGHGVQASLLCSALSHVLTSRPDDGSILWELCGDRPNPMQIVPPAQVAERLNRRFPMSLETCQYFTIIYGVLDVMDSQFRYVTAGHPSPILLTKDGEAKHQQASSVPVGWMQEGSQYVEQILDIATGDRLFLFSDGTFEARNETGEEYGMDRILEFFQQHRQSSLHQLLDDFVQSLHDWTHGPLQDDLSILAVERSRE